jgi:DNA-binding transcriptional LysR family regulator
MARMNYRLDELRALVTLHACGSFIRAAQAENITQSAFSRRIIRLEETLGGRLVERTTRKVALTDLGLELVSKLGPLLDQVEESMSSTGAQARGESGRIVVACLTTVAHTIFPIALRQFRKSHANVRLHLRDDSNERVLQAVLGREAELGVCAMAHYPSQIHAQHCVNDSYVIAFPPRHKLAKMKAVAWADLAGFRVVGMRSTNSNRQLIDAALQAADIPLPWFDEVEYLSSLMGLLQEGSTIGVLPGLAIPLSQAVKLQTRPLVQPRIERKISLIRRVDGKLTRAGQAFWDAVQNALSATAN